MDDPKRLVPKIAHVFMGTILRWLSSGQLILVLKTVLNDKSWKYTSVLKTTISTKFVEYCWYGWSKKMNEGVVINIPFRYEEEVWTLIKRFFTLEHLHKRLTAFFWTLEKLYVKRTWHVFVDRESNWCYSHLERSL